MLASFHVPAAIWINPEIPPKNPSQFRVAPAIQTEPTDWENSVTFEPSTDCFPRKAEEPTIDFFARHSKYQLALFALKKLLPKTVPIHSSLQKISKILGNFTSESKSRKIYKNITKLLRKAAIDFNKNKLPTEDIPFFQNLLKERFSSWEMHRLYDAWRASHPPVKKRVYRVLQSVKGMFNQQTFLNSMNIPHLREIREKQGNTIYRYACPTPLMKITLGKLIIKVLSYIGHFFGGKIYEPERVDPLFIAYLKHLKDRNETVLYNTLQTARSPFLGLKKDEAARVRALQKVVEETGHIFMVTSVTPKKDPTFFSYDFEGTKSFDTLKAHLLQIIRSHTLHNGFYLKTESFDPAKIEEIITNLHKEHYNNKTEFSNVEWQGFLQNFIARLRLQRIDCEIDPNREKKIHVFASCMDDIDRGGVQYALEHAWEISKQTLPQHHIRGRAYLVKSRDMTNKWKTRLEEALKYVPLH